MNMHLFTGEHRSQFHRNKPLLLGIPRILDKLKKSVLCFLGGNSVQAQETYPLCLENISRVGSLVMELHWDQPNLWDINTSHLADRSSNYTFIKSDKSDKYLFKSVLLLLRDAQYYNFINKAYLYTPSPTFVDNTSFSYIKVTQHVFFLVIIPCLFLQLLQL